MIDQIIQESVTLFAELLHGVDHSKDLHLLRRVGRLAGRRWLPPPPWSGAGPGGPPVSVIGPITMLLGLDEQHGELVGCGPIAAEVAREIAAEEDLTAVADRPDLTLINSCRA